MKLRLPNKLQAALMAALASVSFTTLSSGTLSAAFFFGSQAFAEEAADNTGATIDIGDTNLDAQAAIDEEEGRGEAKEPGSAPINQAGFNGVIGSSDDADRILDIGTSTDVTSAMEVTADSAGEAGQGGTASSGLGSDDLGFTSNPYAGATGTQSNGSEEVFQMPAPATTPVADSQPQASQTTTTSSGTGTSFGSAVSIPAAGGGAGAIGGYGSYGSIYHPVSTAAAPATRQAETSDTTDTQSSGAEEVFQPTPAATDTAISGNGSAALLRSTITATPALAADPNLSAAGSGISTPTLRLSSSNLGSTLGSPMDSSSFSNGPARTVAVASVAAPLMGAAGEQNQANPIIPVYIADWEGYDASTGVATLGNTGPVINHGEFNQPNQAWNSNWNFLIVVKASTLTANTTYNLITTTLFQNNKDGYINGAQMTVSADGTTATIINQGWKNGNTSGEQTIRLNDVETLTFVMSREGSNSGNVVLRGYADGQFNTALVTAAVSNVNLSFSANIRQVNVGALDGLTPHQNVESGVYQVSDDSIGAFGITKAGYNLNATLTVDDLKAFYDSAAWLTWAGNSTNHTWANNSATPWTEGTFTSGLSVVFNAAAEEHNVLIQSAITANYVGVRDNYTFSLSGDASLSASAIEIASGSSLTVNGDAVTAGRLTVADGASLALANGNTLSVTDDVTLTGSAGITVGEGSTLKITSGAIAKALMTGTGVTNNGTFEITNNVQLDNGSSTQMGGTLKVNAGVTLTLSTAKNNPTNIASFSDGVILAGGTLKSSSSMGTVYSVSTIENSKIHFEDFQDMSGGQHTQLTTFAGDTSIAANKTLEVYTKYKSNIKISHLTGAGELKLTTEARNDAGETLAIDSVTDFSGSITVAPGNANNPVKLNATFGSGVNMSEVTVNNGGMVTFNASTPATITTLNANGGTTMLDGETSISRLIVNGAAAATVGGSGAITVTSEIKDQGVEIGLGKSLTLLTADLSATTIHNNGTLIVGNGVDDSLVKARYFVNGNNNGGVSSFEIKAHSTLAASGGDTGDTHASGLVMSEWNNDTAGTVSGKLLVQNGSICSGDHAFTLNIENGGLVAALGVKSKNNAAHAINLREGGTLVLGGASTPGTGAVLNAFAGATVGTYSGNASYSGTINTGTAVEGKTLTIDTSLYTFNQDGTVITKGNTAGGMTLSGSITGDGNITKAGSGTLTLTGNNTYTGGTTISAGTLVAGSATALGSGNIQVNSGATLQLAASTPLTTSGSLTFDTGAALTITGISKSFVGSTTPITVATATGGITLNGVTPTIGTPAYTGTITLADEGTTLQVSNVQQNGSILHLYILTGQSNSLGAVKADPASAALQQEYASTGLLFNGNMSGGKRVDDTSWLPVGPQKPIYNGNGCMGPEYGFSYMMQEKGWYKSSSDAAANDGLGVIKVSRDGGGDENWVKGQGDYNLILSSIKTALDDAQNLTIDGTQKYDFVCVEGLLYEQGESNNHGGDLVKTRYLDLLQNLNADLTAAGYNTNKVILDFTGNTVLGEIASWYQNDTSEGTEKSAGNTRQMQEELAASRDDIGFVYTRDLEKINPGDDMGVHYNGESQITIGARYAYAFAVQNGIDVSVDLASGVKGIVRGANDEVALTADAAWWGGTAPAADQVAVWDVSSVSTPSAAVLLAGKGNYIDSGDTWTVGGIEIQDAYKKHVTIKGGTISLGAQGITLAGGDLTTDSTVTVRESQTWNTAAAGQQNTLNLTGTTTIASGATVTVEGASIVNISTLAGTGGLTVNGEGAVVTLTDKTAFTGATTVTSGTLKIAGADDLDITGNLTINGNAASFAGNITADTITLSNIATSGSQDTFDKYAGVITGTHTITLDHYTVDSMAASLVTESLVATNSTSTTIHNLTLTACEVSVDGGSNLTLADRLTLGDSATYTGTLNLADGLTIDVSNMTLGGAGTSVALLSTESGNLGDTDISKLSVDFGSGSPAPEYSLSLSGNNLMLTLGAAGNNLIWDNAKGDHRWTTSENDKNWHLDEAGSGTSYFTDGSNVTFKSGVADMMPQLQQAITAGTITVEQNASVIIRTQGNTLTATGLIGGGNVTQWGNGRTTVNGPVSLASLDVVGGTMVLNSTAGGSIGTFKSSGGTNTTLTNIAASTTNGEGQTLAGNLTLNSGSVLTVLGNDSLNYGASNTITINEGASINFSNARWTIGTNNKIVLAGGSITGTGEGDNGALDLSQDATVKATEDSSVSVPIRLRNKTITFEVSDSKKLTVDGLIKPTDAGSLIKTGTGTLLLSGANTYNTNTNINAGTVETASETALGTSKVTIASGATLKVSENLTVQGGSAPAIDNSGTIEIADGKELKLHATATGRKYNLGKVSLLGQSATIVDHWQNAEVNLNVIDGGASSKLTLISSHCSTASNFNIGAAGATTQAADAYKGTLVLADRLTDGSSGRTANFNLRDGGLLDGATLQIQNFDTKGKSMINNISLQAATVKVGGVNDADASTVDSSHVWSLNSGLSGSGVATLQLTGTGNYSSAVAINSNVNLLKTGSGTQTLSGNNANMNGTVTVNAGTLVANSANALGTGTTTVNSGGTLELTNLVSSVSGNVNVGTGGTLKLALYGDDAAFTASTGLTLASGSILDLSQLSISGSETSPITLVKGGNIDSSHLSGVQIEFASEIQGAKLAVQNGNLVLTFEQVLQGLVWDNSASDNKWDIENSYNWHASGSTDHGTAQFASDSNVIFESGVTNSPELQSDITAGTMKLESGASVTVSGSSYKLTVNDIDAAGATLTLSTGSAQINDAAVVGALNGSAALELAYGSSLTVSGDNSSAYSGVISGSGSLTKDGDGTLTLSGANTFSGDLTISHGVVKMGNNRALGQLNNVSGVTRTIQVNAGGTLDYSGTEGGENGYKVTLNGGTLTNTGIGRGSNARQVVTSLVLQADSTIDAASNMGIIANGYGATSISLGDYTLEKTGTNNLYLNNTAITGGGSIKVSAGSVVFNDRSSDSQLGSLSSNLELAGGNVSGKINLGDDITVTSSGNGGSINADIKGSSKITKTGDVALSMSGNYNNYTGTLDNASSAAISMTLNGSQTTMGITSTGGGAVNLSLNASDYKLNGNQQVNNITQNTSWSAYIGGSGNVTATGTVRTGRLVVGNMDSDSNAVFTLSGPGAMLNTSDGSHTYSAKVQGYGTFALANGATQTLSGNLAEYNGTFKATGTGSVLTLSNILGSGADLLAENGGKISLTSSVTAADAVSVGGNSTLALASRDTNALSVNSMTLDSGSILDLSALNLTGEETNDITLVRGDSISGPTDWSSVTLKFGKEIGKDYTLDVQGNSLVLTFAQPEPAKDLIWDGTSNTWASGSSQHWHEDGSSTLVSFTNGDNATFDLASSAATVTVSGAVTAGSVAVESGANVTLVTDSANTLTATSGITVEGTLVLDGTNIGGELSGSGVVVGHDIPSAVNWNKNQVLGNLTLDADDWTGTVEVGGGHHEFSAPYVVLNSINQLATENSTVRLKGVGGYFDGGTITANIELVNPDDASPAVLITAGNNKTTTFSGSISGSGDLKFDKNGGYAETFKFTGDISLWNGSLTTGTQHTGALTVELADSADEVNAAIMQGGDRRALNLKVDNDATFKNTVKVSKVEIAGSEASATFMGDTEIGTLTGAGKLVVDGANTTTTIGSGSNFNGDIDLLGGTLDLTNALTGVGAVNLGTGTTAATLKLAGGGNALGSNSTITLGSNLTLDLSNYNSSLSPVEGGTTSVTLATATGTGGITGDAASVSLTGLTLEEGYKASLGVDGTTNLVLTVRDESEQLYWLDSSGTWTAKNSWYQNDQQTRNTFQNGDSVTIVGGKYDEDTTIRMVADASARNMTVTKADDVSDATVIIQDTVNQNRLAAKTLELEDGVTLVTNTQLEVTESMVLNNNTELKLNSPKDATISADISAAEGAQNVVITKQGDNTLTLTGDNTHYNGAIDVTDGTLAAQSANALGKASVTVSKDAKLSLENRAAMNGASLTMENGSIISFLGDTELNLTGSLTLGDGVTWDLTRYGFDRPAEGQTTASATLITLTNADSFDGNFGTGYVINTPGIVSNARLSYDSTNSSVILTYDMDSQGDLFWMGGVGNWNGNSDNLTWYPMREGGDLTQFYKGDNVTFDNRAAVSPVTLTEDITAGTVTVENGTHVTLRGASDTTTLTAEQIDISGTLGTQVNVAAGTVNIQGTGTWNVSDDKDRVFAGELAGTGTLAKSGTGDLELAHSNTAFTGEIQLNSGTITAANANAFGTDTTIVMGNGTELKQAEGVTVLNMGGKTIEVTNPGTSATVSANLDVAAGTILTFAGDGNLAVTQAVTGTGTLSQNGYGTLRLDDVDAFQGSIVINQGGVALGSATNTVDSINVGINTALTFAGTRMMDINTLTLANGSTVDLSNVTFTDNHATLAIVSTLNAPVSGSSGGNYYCVEGVAAVNAQGLDEGSVVRLRYQALEGGKTEFYAEIIPQPDKVVFWKGAGENDPLGYPEGSGIWRPTNTELTQDEDRALGYLVDKNGQPTVFEARNNGGTRYSSSINFFTLYDSNGDLIEEATVNVQYNTKGSTGIEHIRTMIIDGETRYIIQAENNDALNEDIQLSSNAVSTLIVKSGAQAEIRDSFASKDASLVLVEEGAKLDYITADAKDRLDFSFMENRGELAIQTGMAEIARLTNSGTISIEGRQDWMSEGYSSSISLGEVVNTGNMVLSGDGLYPAVGDMISQNVIVNEGNLTYMGQDNNPSLIMVNALPTLGRGIVDTAGDKPILFDQVWSYAYATVEASELNLGAASTTFNYGVDITDTTTVKAGKDAYFYGGTGVGETAGSLGEVTLEDEATVTFGPRVEVDPWGDEPPVVTAQSYDMGHVTAGADSVLIVQKGATVTMAGYNAASGVPAGEIVVGTMPTDAPTGYAGTASLTIDGPAAVDTVRVLNGTATVEGNASINQIMQDDGVLTLKVDSVLNGTDGNGGTVTGGTLALAGGVTLEQNAVIDVRDGGAYTVSGGTGSRIDATGLELIVDRTNTLYREVVKKDGEPVISGTALANRSGFISSGDEYVKLFDMAEGTTLTSNDEAVYHASASGMMTLIGDDNLEEIKKSIGDSTFNVEEHIGYGYLHTSKLALKTYYVRDTYTEDDHVTLSDIVTASIDLSDPLQEPQLANVVFDKTAYSELHPLYNGTLTVDTNVAVDLFSVSSDAKAAINIARGATVTANADSPGVQGNLDLQGSGVYEIQNRNDLGANIALRDNGSGESTDPEWNGTVRVTGTSTDLTLEDKYVGTGADASTIEFKNWNGALDGGEHTSVAKIVLTGTTEAPTAMKLTGEDAIAYTFTNTVSGSGNIDHAEGGNVAMTFTGDTSGWNGTYEQLSDTEDSLTFTGGTTVSAKVTSGNGSMNLTYGGSVTTVAGGVNVYSGGDTPTTMNVAYTGGGAEEGSVKNMEVTGGITSDAQSSLTLTVGDGESRTAATFSGIFAGTENATMAVQSGSTATIGTATIDTNAELLRVLGDEGSNVVVNSGSTLSLASTTPETGYSEFHDLTNAGTIEMMANGGEIHLVDDTAEGNTYNLGNLVLTDPVGTATIETSGVEGKTTNVNITGLTGPKSAAQVLELTNGNGTGTVNYNLGNTDDTKDLNGTIAYGGSGGVTNLVIKENGNSAASAVLETRFTSADAGATANIVVDAEAARVLGLSSDGNSANKAMKVSGREDPGDPGNRTLNITGDGNYTYAGTLGSNLDIAYTGDGSQTIEGGVENFSGKVTVDNGSAQAGVLELLNASSVNITDLTIGANDTLDLKKNDSNVGTAVVSGTMKAGGAGGTPSKLEGSLTLGSGSTYDVSAAGGTGGLNLTGALTIDQGARLSTGDMGVVWNMGVGDTYDLAFGVTDMSSFGSNVNWEEGVDASTVFGNGMKEGEYYIRYSGTGEGGHGGNVGAVYLFRVAVPEPTTSTLSLLALAALAARRRRK